MKTTVKDLHGLYAITDPRLSLQRGLPVTQMVEAAIRGGARIIQYRDKNSPAHIQRHEAQSLANMCREQGVIFLINDNVELALAVAADGVHLGQSDAGIKQARDYLGPQAIIGITCHDQLQLAYHAQQAGADYVAFGRFFPSQTKPDAPPADLTVLQQARTELRLPIAAIGGITPANALNLLAHGADMLAVIHGVFGAADITAAAGEYARLFTVQSRHASHTGG